MDVTSYIAGSFVAHFVALAAISTTMPDMPTSDDLMDDHQQMHTFQMFVQAEQIGVPIEDGIETRCGDCTLAMGDSDADMTNHRYGVAGPADNPDPHVSRLDEGPPGPATYVPGPTQPWSFGTEAPSAPWGRDDALGTDPIDARGSLWGEAIGDKRGDEGLGGRHDREEKISGYGYRCRMP